VALLKRRLAQSANAPVDRLELARDTADVTGRAVDVQVTRLRRKIEVRPEDPRYLQTVRGVGYRWRPTDAPARARSLARQIKRCLPTTLFGRSLLIIILPIALMQVAVTWVFFDAHWQTVTSRLSDGPGRRHRLGRGELSGRPAPGARPHRRPGERSMSLSVAIPDRPHPAGAPAARPCSGRWTARWTRRWPAGSTCPSGSIRPATPATSTSGCRCPRG
jgi:hypothetical protein